MNAPPLWKATISLRKSESPDVVALLDLTPPLPQAVLIAEDPFRDEAIVEALYTVMPDGALLERLAGKPVHVSLLPDSDWIKLSQEGLPPVRAGRFFVYGAHDAGVVPDGVIPIRIEAGMAFGTGHHETTALCLAVLSELSKKRRYTNVLDLGCGTGLLAIGAAKLWRRRVMASDIDAVAIEVTRENAVSNGEGALVRAVTADGLTHPALAARAPYDLVIANILAGPLTRLAPQISRAVAVGGTIVLSGLLRWQENLVLAFYRPHGLVYRAARRDGPWSALILERPGRARQARGMDKNAPFQTYDDRSDAATCAPRLAALRTELAKRGLDGFVVPHSDEYQSEYLPARGERLAWLTAFTGSAGAAVVLRDRAAVFVDGRYTLQVQQQTDTKLFEPRDLVAEGPAAWIEANASKGSKLGYDPWVHTASGVDALRLAAAKAGAELIACATNPIDTVWTDQPEAPLAKAVPHDISLAGETAESKRMRIAEDVKRTGADAAVVTLSDSICWLLNMRGGDTPHTPFVLSYAILNADGSTDLFMDGRKSSPELMKHFGNAVRIREPGEFTSALDALKGKTVLVDPTTAPAAIFERLNKAGAAVKRGSDPIQLPKACKNPIEIEGTRKAHLRDGAALTRFLAWIAREAPNGQLTEIEASQTLEGYRRATGALTDLSFDSISGAGSNGAVVHYRVTQSTNRTIRRDEIFLIDSGGQYPDGTTDVTRTMIVGKPTAEMRDRFTRVLKGHISLSTAKFPDGTTGAALDAFARRPLWEAGLDYDHGTGHGVGSYLSVHEGPQNISKRPATQSLRPGMICSNEPGYYKAGEYGIRIENLIVVTDGKEIPSGERRMMEFETITFAPIDLELVEPSLLTADEKAWLNGYHAKVREKISPQVDEETRGWLANATRAI